MSGIKTLKNAKSSDIMDKIARNATHQVKDVIAIYGKETGLSAAEVNEKVLKYRKNILQFAIDEGLVSTSSEKKIFEYMSRFYSLPDSAIKFVVLDLGLSRADCVEHLLKVREGFTAVADSFGNIVVEPVTPSSNLNQPDAD